MTEKRFILYEHKDNDYILDNPNEHLDFIEMLGDALTSEEIVDLLNEQNETVQRLEGENNQLAMSLTEIMEIVLQNDFYRDLMKEAIKELSEEGLELEEMI